MFGQIKLPVIAFFVVTFFVACNGGEMKEMTTQSPRLKDVPASSWEKLSKRKIYFGHQSVGFNIIDGIRDLMEENSQIKLNVVETADPADFKVALFAHSRVGKNMDPKSKSDAFENLMKRIGERVDISFFKFCYVDIGSRTDVDKVFSDYKNAMARLKKAYPREILLHVTAPLTTTQMGIKAWIKKLIGRPIGGYDENIKRNQFNQLVRNEYEGKNPIFDLAKIESSLPDGSRSSFTKDGKTYYSLVPDYTYDGGHLNETGRKKVAEQLLILFTNLLE